jgi:hypothetical protein
LRALGDEQSAAVVEQAARAPSWEPAAQSEERRMAPESDNPVRLLLAAQAPLEELSETLEGAMRRMEGELFGEAEQAAANVIARIATISLQAERRLQPDEPAKR